LTEERLRHILSHPEMAGLEAAITEAVRKPQAVVISRSDENVRLFYRLKSTAIFGEKWLCVVIKYAASDSFVLTAYLTDKIKRGEIVWPKP
jgi:hypothetical protein